MNGSEVRSKATHKEWLGLLVLALPCMIYSMDLTVLNLALPQISADLKPSVSQLLWIVDIYGFFVAGSLITMGTLGDSIGRRKMLLLGAFSFAVASALAAFSRSAETLIVTRALQGIAGATLAPSTLSLIRVLFKDAQQRVMAVGLWGTSFSVGALIGPIIGGALIEKFWWGSVFLINIPVMIVLLIVGPKILPEYKNPGDGKIDIISAALSLIALLSVIFGIKKLAENGLEFLPFLIICFGLVTGFFFVYRQKKLTFPLIDLNLFTNFTFNALLVTNAFTMFALFGTFIFSAQYMQLVMGLSPFMAGVWSLASPVGFLISSLCAPHLAKRIRPAYIMAAGLSLGALGFFLSSQVQGSGDLYLLVLSTAIFSFGSSPVLLFTTSMIVNSAPSEKAGTAAALSETGNELGGALGIALLGSIGTHIYKKHIEDSMPSTISPDLKSAALGTLENALQAASIAPEKSGQFMVELIQRSYTEAFNSVMLLSSLLLVALTVLVLYKLRHLTLEAEHGSED